MKGPNDCGDPYGDYERCPVCKRAPCECEKRAAAAARAADRENDDRAAEEGDGR